MAGQDEIEAQEIDLAAELISAGGEQELDQFIGRMFRRLGRALPSGLTRSLGGLLKGVAKRALPIVGGALGTIVAPGVGTAVGRALGSAAGNLFEIPEGEFPEGEMEFEVARRFVRLADEAIAQAAQMPPGSDPQLAAREALRRAAATHAPGLASALGQRAAFAGAGAAGRMPAAGPRGRSGRWMRRGRAIILLDGR
jgi:hypothetical protein